MSSDSIFLEQWKADVIPLIKMRYPNKSFDKKKLDKYVTKLFHKHVKNPKVRIHNNYQEKEVRMDLLALIDVIHENDLIIGGGGVLYVQHESGKKNPTFNYIITKQGLRSAYKDKRKAAQRANDEANAAYFDILQLATKIIINSLYGVHGYERFVLFNKYLAESVTNMGRQIICTAIMVFENFLSGSVKYNTENEVYKFILNVKEECDKSIDCSIFTPFIGEDFDQKILDKILNTCAFKTSDEFISNLKQIIQTASFEEKILLYYKNNLYEFSRLPFIMEKLQYVFSVTAELKEPNWDKLPKHAREVLEGVWEFYETFVFYNYPIFDRVRKSMFTDKESVLYVDTDSNFLGLARWVKFCTEEVMHNAYPQEKSEFEFIVVNTIMLILANVIHEGLMTLGKYMGSHEEYRKRLEMKNEFYMSRIMFVEGTKKRYISLTKLQEGVLLNNGEGKIDIKGFDFKKAGTKEYIRNIYSDICENDILRAETIDINHVYRRVMELKEHITQSLLSGKSEFFKQTTVQLMDHYANPFSTQQYVAALLWNTLCPEYTLELPIDVDLCPIHDITGPTYVKNTKGELRQRWSNQDFVDEFRGRWPDVYELLDKKIYQNRNEKIRNMKLTTIAKPKNEEIPIPDWFNFLLDVDTVVNDDIKLIAPVLQSLGLTNLKTDASTEHVSNVVEL